MHCFNKKQEKDWSKRTTLSNRPFNMKLRSIITCYSKPKQNYRHPQPKRHTQANLAEEDDGKYDDILQAFIVKAFVIIVPLPSPKDDTWYFDIGATNHLTHWKVRATPTAHPCKIRQQRHQARNRER
jgi:hypothetical protein